MYGKCIAADFNGVYKDKCLIEFLKLKDCYTVCDSLYKEGRAAILIPIRRLLQSEIDLAYALRNMKRTVTTCECPGRIGLSDWLMQQ